jgi:hypothetical protein
MELLYLLFWFIIVIHIFFCIRPLLGIMPMSLHCEPRLVSRASMAVGFDAGRTGQGSNTYDLCVSNTAFICPVTLCMVFTSAVNFTL